MFLRHTDRYSEILYTNFFASFYASDNDIPYHASDRHTDQWSYAAFLLPAATGSDYLALLPHSAAVVLLSHCRRVILPLRIFVVDLVGLLILVT